MAKRAKAGAEPSRRDRGAELSEEPRAPSPLDATVAAGSSAVPVQGEGGDSRRRSEGDCASSCEVGTRRLESVRILFMWAAGRFSNSMRLCRGVGVCSAVRTEKSMLRTSNIHVKYDTVYDDNIHQYHTIIFITVHIVFSSKNSVFY